MHLLQWIMLLALVPFASCDWWQRHHQKNQKTVTVTRTKTRTIHDQGGTVTKTVTTTRHAFDVVRTTISSYRNSSATRFRLEPVTITKSCSLLDAEVSTVPGPVSTIYITSTESPETGVLTKTVFQPQFANQSYSASTSTVFQTVSQDCPLPAASVSAAPYPMFNQSCSALTQTITSCPILPTGAPFPTLNQSCPITSTQTVLSLITQNCSAPATFATTLPGSTETITLAASLSISTLTLSESCAASATAPTGPILTPLRSFGVWSYLGCAENLYFAGGSDFWNATDPNAPLFSSSPPTYTSVPDCLNYCASSPLGVSAGNDLAVLRNFPGNPQTFCECGNEVCVGPFSAVTS